MQKWATLCNLEICAICDLEARKQLLLMTTNCWGGRTPLAYHPSVQWRWTQIKNLSHWWKGNLDWAETNSRILCTKGGCTHDHVLISQVNLLHQILVFLKCARKLGWDRLSLSQHSLPAWSHSASQVSHLFSHFDVWVCNSLYTDLFTQRIQDGSASDPGEPLSTPVSYSLDTTISGDLGGVRWVLW